MIKKILALLLILQLAQSALPVNFTWANKDGINYMGVNQNQNFPNRCESGWAFATINSLNARLKIRMKNTNFKSPIISLSPQVLLECDGNDFGCLGGEPASALRWIKKNNITDESCNTYKAKGYTNGLSCSSRSKCQSCSAKNVCKGQQNSKIYALGLTGSVSGQDQIMNQIYQYGPVACGISSTNEFKNYVSGVFKDTTGSYKFDHYVSIYGWGETSNGQKYWNVMNSYGPAWGQEGNIRVWRGNNNLGIEGLCYWASFRDTWTNDVRNETLPTSNPNSLKKEENEEIKQQLILPSHVSQTKNMLSPNYCDASWAFSITHMLSDIHLRRTNGLSHRGFSVQALLNCGVGTCEKASDPFDALVFIHKYGIPEQGCQTYRAQTPAKQNCSSLYNCASCGGNSIFKQSCTEVKNYKRWKIESYGTAIGESQIKMQIDNNGAVVCSIQNSNAFKEYKGGIFSETTISPKTNYYVELIGYGTENKVNYWIGRNSIGTSWGLSGFFKIKRGSQVLGIESKCYWAGPLL